MHLPAPSLESWIEALRKDPEATTTALPSSPFSPMQEPATWRLGIQATAYFYVLSMGDVHRLVEVIPELHQEFQQLTGHALSRYLAFETGSIARQPHSQELIEAHFQENSDDIAALKGFDAPTRESSSRFLLQTIAQFRHAQLAKPVFRPCVDKPIIGREIKFAETVIGLDYLTLNFPPSFWQSRKEELRTWWLSALDRLKPVQAYMGLGIGLPPVLERYPFQQPAEFALANRFLGLDVDKPFFSRSNRPNGMNLECGMRTPGYGVLVCGDYARLLGGIAALHLKLQNVPGIHMRPCMDGDGLWIEAGDAPALYPVEEGVPVHLRALAEALKPVRLQRLWMVSYPPNVPRDDIFTPESSARWLRRFDSDSDWGGLVHGEPPRPQGSSTPAPSASPRSAHAGEACPQTGNWQAPRLDNRIEHVERGQSMPGPTSTDTGSVIWYLLVD
ncbi:type VI immunity family protein [Variovorax boronicumulans]|uniref:type VI immunity family protein n=1 Tax=Variovorax boronicumulans TaxID=436515 RepID=UPI0008635DAB|nr:type VI immunity family protein [Variovorax boronicumulans]